MKTYNDYDTSSNVNSYEEESNEVTIRDVLCIHCKKSVANPKKCSSCNQAIHEMCSDYKKYSFVVSATERWHWRSAGQAENILKSCNATLPPLVVNTIRCAFQISTAAVSLLEVTYSCPRRKFLWYRLCTKNGYGDRLYARNKISAASSGISLLRRIPAASTSLRSTSVLSPDS